MFELLKVLVATSSVSIALGGASLAVSAASADEPTSPAAGVSCSPTTVPRISSVSAVAAIEQTQTITITGTCFGSGNTFTATAQGDLNGDGVTSTFTLLGTIGAGFVLNIAPLHELVPWKDAKSYWEELLKGEYEWSSIGKQLRQKGLVK